MAILPVAQPGIAGTNPAMQAANAGGDSFPNSGMGERLRIRNGGGSACNVTIVAQNPAGCPAGLVHNVVVNVPAGQERVVRGLSPERFNDGNNRVQLTYDQVASVLVGVEL